MDAELERKLDRLKNYHTRYELVATSGDRKVLLGYTTRNNRRGLWAVVTDESRVQAVIKLVGTESIHFAKRAADGATMGEWTIRFSGRTQRECYIEGELPYVTDIA